MPLTICMALLQRRLSGKCSAQVASVSPAPAASPVGMFRSLFSLIFSGSRPLLLEREHAVDLRHHGGAFTDRGGDTLGRAGADVPDREHTGHAGLERQRRAAGGGGGGGGGGPRGG